MRVDGTRVRNLAGCVVEVFRPSIPEWAGCFATFQLPRPFFKGLLEEWMRRMAFDAVNMSGIMRGMEKAHFLRYDNL
jgi:hypothetical protein